MQFRDEHYSKVYSRTVKMLLIDDDPFLLEIMRRVIIPGRRVEQARTCTEGLERLRKEQFDVVLLDLNMVVTSGMECLIKIREEFPYLPVIMITGIMDEGLADKAADLGADDFLLKEQLKYLISHVVWSAMKRRQAKLRIEREKAVTLAELERLRGDG